MARTGSVKNKTPSTGWARGEAGSVIRWVAASPLTQPVEVVNTYIELCSRCSTIFNWNGKWMQFPSTLRVSADTAVHVSTRRKSETQKRFAYTSRHINVNRGRVNAAYEWNIVCYQISMIRSNSAANIFDGQQRLLGHLVHPAHQPLPTDRKMATYLIWLEMDHQAHHHTFRV